MTALPLPSDIIISMAEQFFISYPIPIKYGFLNRDQKENQKIIEYFLNLKEQNHVITEKGKGWKTDWYSHIDHSQILSPLVGQILDWYIDNVNSPRNNHFPDMIKQQRNLDLDANIWFQGYEKGDISGRHDHSDYPRYSFSYYLNDEPTPLTFVKYDIVNREMKEIENIDFNVKQDMIVFFPSPTPHRVNPVISDRYVLAGNINDIAYKINDEYTNT